jgi:poly(3-hydroxybutyrate) depolymerase
LIVLYPQTVASPFLPSNPQACWDWWSYIDHADSYVTKSGAQIRSIKAMLDALTSGAGVVTGTTPTPAAAPMALMVIDRSDTAVDLAWTQQSGTTAYRVWRAGADGNFAAVGDVAGPSFADAGLMAGAAYRWRVTALVDGVAGPASVEVAASTRATPPPCDNPGQCPVSP